MSKNRSKSRLTRLAALAGFALLTLGCPQAKNPDGAAGDAPPKDEPWVGGEVQFTTPFGGDVESLRDPDPKLIANYRLAKAHYEQRPDDADAIIWLGRRAGYLFRFNEAIEVFGEGIEKHPLDARMYRHRGHRYITTRRFDLAIADFEKAVELTRGTEDQVEPDGAPNPQGIRLTTLQGNIWYHLGLAYYLENDLDNALRAYRQRQNAHRNDDNLVSNGHWLYMILRRLGRDDEAAEVVAEVHPDMTIIENFSYHRMCLFYQGALTEADLLARVDDGEIDDVFWYGLGNWYLYHQGDEAAARKVFDELLDQGQRNSFAYIAAEADMQRLSAE
ncbi:MAG: tetratricopeptide repeat protein [Acidobacteriota bacterium]